MANPYEPCSFLLFSKLETARREILPLVLETA
jgi:hypothetical protein